MPARCPSERSIFPILVMVLIGALVLGCAAPATSLPTLPPEPTSQQPSAEPELPGGDNPSPTAEVEPSDATTQEPDVEATQPAEPTEAASTREPAAQPTAGVEPITERDLSPGAPEEDVAELATANSQFAFELYQNLKEEDGNLFFSPFSISLALAMTYAGARGETEAQMAETLRFTLPQARLHPAFNALDLELASRGQEREGEADPFTLNIASALWGQAGYDFLPEFLELVGVNYGAGMRLLDFAMAPEESRTTINDWVSEATEGKIENLIPEGVLGPGTRLVLTNAIYFFAAWLNPFPESATRDGSFTLLNGDEVGVPMMVQEAGFAYAEGDGYQAIELPYVGSEVSMIVLVPDTGQFEAFEESLDAERLDEVLASLQGETVSLVMPRFRFESSFGLSELLAGMGMPAAFGPDADFSGMTGNRDLAISAVLHKAFVAVDEEGTEAAAATAVVTTEADVQASVELTIDRPFLFVIRDIPSGTVLFVGRVVDPSA